MRPETSRWLNCAPYVVSIGHSYRPKLDSGQQGVALDSALYCSIAIVIMEDLEDLKKGTPYVL